MKTLILCDFDGTISLRDIPYDLVNRFSSGDWRSIDRDYSEGRIGSKEAYVRVAKILTGGERAIREFARLHSAIDPHFIDFYRYCREKGIDVKIISDGLDFYIKAALEIHHLLEIPVYANQTNFSEEGSLEISFPYASRECGLCGTCKRGLVRAHRNEYDSILFVGNGSSDRCAAEESDFVFAKDPLYSFCIDQDMTCHFFRDFHDILGDLKKRIRGIIFDLDGTLIEAYEAIYLGLEEVFQQFGREIFPLGDLKKHLRADLESTLNPFFSPDEIVKGIPVMRKKYEEVYLDKTHFIDGAREVLLELHSRGVILGVASNKFGRFSRGALVHLGVSDYFQAIFGAGDVPRNKPFPDMIQAALKEMRLPVEEAVFVGDILTDIETGKQGGIDVYALPTGVQTRKELSMGRPRRILRTLKELLQVQKGMIQGLVNPNVDQTACMNEQGGGERRRE